MPACCIEKFILTTINLSLCRSISRSVGARCRISVFLNQLNITQSARFFWYRYVLQPPIPNDQIICHSTNVHIIPSTPAIASMCKSLRAGIARPSDRRFGGSERSGNQFVEKFSHPHRYRQRRLRIDVGERDVDPDRKRGAGSASGNRQTLTPACFAGLIAVGADKPKRWQYGAKSLADSSPNWLA